MDRTREHFQLHTNFRYVFCGKARGIDSSAKANAHHTLLKTKKKL